MHSDGIKAGLRPQRGDSIADYTKWFPDHGKWIEKLAKHFEVRTVAALCKKLNYSEPLEFLQMYLCFYGLPTLDQFEFKKIRKKQMIDFLNAERKRIGFDLIPPVAVADAFKNEIV
jgi:hypothetical protein